MNELQQLRFYLTGEHPCGYLPRISRSICLDPEQEISPRILSLLSRQGFRRSGGLLYRPHCPSCNACVAVRVAVQRFRPSRSQQRIIRRGAKLQVSEHLPASSDEYYRLYERYIRGRHADGSMYPPSPEQFGDFLARPLPFTRFYEFRLDSRLLAVAVSDLLEDGLSAVYSFFEPDDRHFSLGRYMVLWQIRHAQQRKLPYLYLGYWIGESRKMNYKMDYRPLEGFLDDRWQAMPDEA